MNSQICGGRKRASGRGSGGLRQRRGRGLTPPGNQSSEGKEAALSLPLARRVVGRDVDGEAHPTAGGPEERLQEGREDEDDVEEDRLLRVEADVAGELRRVVHDQEVHGEEGGDGGEGHVEVQLR